MMNLLCKTIFVIAGIILSSASLLGQGVKERMSCPAKTVKVSTLGDCGAKVNYTEPFEEIAVGELRQIQHNYSSQSFFEVGQTTVYYKAQDQQNNSHFCIFIVEVADGESPVFIDFPENIEVETTATSGITVKWEEPEVFDNCGELTVISSYESGDVFPVGKTEVNYWVHDLAGNVETKNFTVTVKKVNKLLSDLE